MFVPAAGQHMFTPFAFTPGGYQNFAIRVFCWGNHFVRWLPKGIRRLPPPAAHLPTSPTPSTTPEGQRHVSTSVCLLGHVPRTPESHPGVARMLSYASLWHLRQQVRVGRGAVAGPVHLVVA